MMDFFYLVLPLVHWHIMTFEQQLIFLFSAFGAINGFLLSTFFLLYKSEKRLSDYFLGALLAMLSIRVIKSVFLHFNSGFFKLFIQIGLSACLLIGPFLLLYVISSTGYSDRLINRWWWLILPFLLVIGYLMIDQPYYLDSTSWDPYVFPIYWVWGICILIAGFFMRDIFKTILVHQKISYEEKWLINIYVGTAVVWLAYCTAYYTSYIVGALSFSFLLYISILLYIYHRKQRSIATDLPIKKYAGSTLSDVEVVEKMKSISEYMTSHQPYLDQELTLAKLGELMQVSPKELSQIINQSTGQNYSKFISRYRIEEAKRKLSSDQYDNHKIAAIAYDCGFSSLSSFNAAFKIHTGQTASEYRKLRLNPS